MKKTYNINIAGSGFVIDEDAYEMLNSYLNTLTEFCTRTNEKETAIDIEQRIAEIFLEKIAQYGPRIIAIEDVEEVISRMGAPEEIVDIEPEREGPRRENAHQQTPPPFAAGIHVKKRLYRDIDDKVIGGVCSGLAWYIGLDPVWVRVIAVAGLFLSVSWLALIYIVLWIVVPAAKTPFERMQMMGMDPSMRNVGRVVTDQYCGRRTDCEPPYGQPVTSPSVGNTAGRVVMMIFVVLALIVVGSLLIGMGAAFIGCLMALCVSPIGGLNHDMTYVRLVLGCVIGGSIVAGVPLFMLFRTLIGSLTGRTLPTLSSAQNIFLLILWILGVAAVVSCGIILGSVY